MKNICILIFMLLPLRSLAVGMQETFNYYTIAPQSEQDIKLQLRQHSPISRNNQTFHGKTTWQIVPDFRLSKHHILCRVQDVYVTLHGTYTMPKLQASHEVTAPTKDKFDTYYAALLEHEKGHKELWQEAGEKIEHILINFPPHFDCQQLNAQISTRLKQVIVQYQLLNQQYDRDTGHGRTQGAAIK